MPGNIILTGFSGTGKSQAGRAVARSLGWSFVDTDEEIVARTGAPIADLFARQGETRFRELERQVVREACQGEKKVVSTGGGAILDSENRQAMFSSGLVVCLEARPETILQRLSSGRNEARPLLAGEHPLERISALKAERQWAYAMAQWTVHTDYMGVEQVAQEVVRAWQTIGSGGQASSDADVAAVVRHAAGSYPVYVGWGILGQLGRRIREAGLGKPGQRVFTISDSNVFRLHGRETQLSLVDSGIETHSFTFPAGERSKVLKTAEAVYQWLAERRAERGDVIAAVGGGVVGDLAGYVAATYLRGMPFVQVPTSLVAVVDASIGGKVAVDLPEGKNLVGAFYQPRLVLTDVSLLQTLPQRELMEGWAEAIKHGLILDSNLFELFDTRTEDLLALERELTTEVVRRSVAIKAQVVSEDERETLGKRTLLNYGHTIGHALEAAAGYGTYLHGEAVSIGMMGAAMLGHRLGMTPESVIQRQQEVLRRFRLPVAFSSVDHGAILEAMTRDKKTAGGQVQWVLLEELGHAVTHHGVPTELVEGVLRELGE